MDNQKWIKFKDAIKQLRQIQHEVNIEFANLINISIWGLDKYHHSFEFYVDVGINLHTGKLTSQDKNMKLLLIERKEIAE